MFLVGGTDPLECPAVQKRSGGRNSRKKISGFCATRDWPRGDESSRLRFEREERSGTGEMRAKRAADDDGQKKIKATAIVSTLYLAMLRRRNPGTILAIWQIPLCGGSEILAHLHNLHLCEGACRFNRISS